MEPGADHNAILPERDQTSRPDLPAAACRILLLAILLALFHLLAQQGVRLRTFLPALLPVLPYLYGLVLVAGLATLLPSGAKRHRALLAVSVAAAILLLGPGAILVILYALAVVGLARLPIKTRYALLAALSLWALAPIWRFVGDAPAWATSTAMGLIWAGLAFSSLYLLIERGRGSLRGVTLAGELFYLVAIPRLATPFFQAIPASHLFASERASPTIGAAGRGFALGVYGVGLGLFVHLWPELQAYLDLPVAGLLLRMAWLYAVTAAWLFTAVAIFRLLGFDIGAGFRWPLLSTTFADWFRRWNYYNRAAVISLFFFPLVARLRTKLPKNAATILAAYAAIFLGSFGLTTVVVPLATTAAGMGERVFDYVFVWQRFLLLFLYWSAIILPQVGLGRSLPRPTTRGARVVQRVLFWVLLLALMGAGGLLGVDFL